MADIRIREATGTWTVRAGGAVLAESRDALELNEEGCEDVIYFPRADVAMAFLDASAHTTSCPHKGEASHYSIVTKSGTLTDAAWSYEAPEAGLERLAGYLAFYPSDAVAVERI